MIMMSLTTHMLVRIVCPLQTLNELRMVACRMELCALGVAGCVAHAPSAAARWLSLSGVTVSVRSEDINLPRRRPSEHVYVIFSIKERITIYQVLPRDVCETKAVRHEIRAIYIYINNR